MSEFYDGLRFQIHHIFSRELFNDAVIGDLLTALFYGHLVRPSRRCFAIGCVLFMSSFMASAEPPDLSDRDPEFGYRIVHRPTELVKGCLKNFSDTSCTTTVLSYVMGPIPRSSKQIAPLTNLPNNIQNAISSRFYSELVLPSLARCTQDNLNSLSSALVSDGGSSHVSVLVVPDRLSHCFLVRHRVSGAERKVFILKVDTSIVGQINCSAIGIVPNPSCSANYFPSNGLYRITFSPIPFRNIRRIIEQSPKMVDDFLSRVPLEFPNDFVWQPLPSKTVVSPAAEMEITKAEEELK